ncbi:hypothetical protein E2C01_041594 [Portunus trituberculatus]|uniref:Uncharacterized protein n=1 Tax=Portunus trituberculatus TaxID=210409 RepID=A0A5B7FQS6_PORTR|nr:hypothetical protein [Portunus trituberculatus]
MPFFSTHVIIVISTPYFVTPTLRLLSSPSASFLPLRALEVSEVLSFLLSLPPHNLKAWDEVVR